MSSNGSNDNSSGKNLTLKNRNTKDYLTIVQKIFQFGRLSNRKNDDNFFFIDDKNISKIHSIILQNDDKYYLMDENTLNGTYIVVPLNKSLVLQDKMVLKIGAKDFTIHLKSFNEIELEFKNENEKLEFLKLDLREDQICMGYDENEKKDSKFLGFNDEDLAVKHVIFHKNKNFLVLADCFREYFIFINTLNKVLLIIRVKIKLIPQMYYLLAQGIHIELAGKINYVVKEIKESKKIKCCYCGKGANVICLPCEHQFYCNLCNQFENFKNCKKCNKKIENVLNIVKLKFL